MLRFGRLIGPDSLPANARNLQQIPLGYGRQGWIDLNRPEIKKLSDADFPYWHWKRITEEDGPFNPNDGKCEPAALLPLLDKNHDGLLAPLEFARFVREEDNRKRLSYAICKFPSEWDASDFDQRWGWLKAYFKNPASREKELAQNHKAWLSTVQERLAPLQTNAERQLDEVKDARQDVLEDKTALDKCLQENTKKRADLEQKLKQQNALLAKQQKNKTAKTEDIDKTTNGIFDTDNEIIAVQEQRAEIKQAVARIGERLDTADLALKVCEQTLDSIKRDMQKIPEELKAADAEIKRADEDLKKNPPNPNSDKLWQEFKAHVTALQFWDKVPGLPNAKQVWHFHPVAFVEHFKKCAWLNKPELERIYDKQYVGKKYHPNHETVLEFHRQAINKVFYKYGVSTPIRMAHYLAQGAVESTSLHRMQEAAMTPKKIENGKAYGNTVIKESTIPETELGHWFGSAAGEENEWLHYTMYTSTGTRIASSYSWRNGNCGDIDALKFRGRGFHQLTGLEAYSNYWVYRGWLRQDSFDRHWWDDPAYKAKNIDGMNKRYAVINDPHRVTANAYNCIDTAGWELSFNKPKAFSAMDKDANTVIGSAEEEANIKAVTKAINGGDVGIGERIKHTKFIKEIML